MKLFVDWSASLLPRMRGEIETVEESLETIRLLQERFGFNRYFMNPAFDAQREPTSHFLLRRAQAAERLGALLPSNCRMLLGASIVLTPNLSECDGLERLLLRKAILPIVMPLTEYGDWIDLELNHLLYRRKYRLLFLTFERSLILYPLDVIERLLRIEGAIFQFGFRSLCNPACCQIILSLLRQNRAVLLGTGISSLNAAYAYDLTYYLDAARKWMHEDILQTLLRSSNAFWRKLAL